MAALMYVDVPGYAALILRRTFPELEQPEGPIWQSMRWFGQAPSAVRPKYTQGDHLWRFPSGAVIRFGHLDSADAVMRYQGGAYTLVCFDELTHFEQEQYEFIGLSRQRKPPHGPLAHVPIRIRASANPGGPGHCVPYGDVLTPSGWKPIETFAVGDDVYAVTADGELVESRVEQTHRHVSEVVTVDARGLHMAVTPEHRVAKVGGTRAERGRSFSLVPFRELPGQATVLRSVSWRCRPLPAVTAERPSDLRPARHEQPRTLTGDQYARLLGWYLTEGCLVKRDRAIAIAQSKPESRRRLRAFLEHDCGFTVTWSATGATIYAPGWYEHLSSAAPGLCREKAVPASIKQAPPATLAAFLDAAMDGDGCWQTLGQSGTFYSFSRRLADDVAEIAVKLGYVVHCHSRSRPDRVGDEHSVSIKRTKSGGTELLTGHHVYAVATTTRRRTRIERTAPQPVYCIGLPSHHAFVIRQRGSVWVSGNSWVKQRFLTQPNDRVDFIPAKLRDNPGIDADDYLSRLSGLSPVLRQQLIDGDWDAFEGAAYGMFSDDVHLVDPFEVPREWERFECMDYGAANPTSWAPVAVDYDGNLIVYGLYYSPGLATDHALAILALRESSWGQPTGVWADPSIRNKTGVSDRMGRALSVEQEFSDHGISIVPANNDRAAGYMRVAQLLRPDPERLYPHWHARYGERGAPRLFFVRGACDELVSQVRSAPVEQFGRLMGKAVDGRWETTQGHAHAMLRYGVMSRPLPHPAPVTGAQTEQELREEAARKMLDKHTDLRLTYI